MDARLQTRGFIFFLREDPEIMSAELLSTGQEGNPGSGPSFRSKQRKILNRLLERDTSFTTSTYLPRTPVSKVSDDSANLSILSG